jgi:hypothetical protein
MALYWDQKIENHDDWIMNYHGVQLQPRILEALIACLQFSPEHRNVSHHGRPSPAFITGSQPRSTGRSALSFRAEEAGMWLPSDFRCLSKQHDPYIELSSASTLQRIRTMLVRDPYSTKAD